MKKYIILITLAALFTLEGFAQKTPAERKEIRHQNNLLWKETAKYAFGVHTGIDIGAAAPWPVSGLGAGAKMSAVPKLNPALGVSFTTYPLDRFTFTAEVTYKQVGIDAKARVPGQRFTLIDEGGRSTIEFRGTAHMKMAFSMLEVPFYVGYSFGDGRNRVFLGGYYSYIFKAEFNTTPYKGVVVNPDSPHEPPMEIKPGADLAGVMPDFNSYMDDWDAGMLVGYEWQIIPRINLSVRFSMGFKDIFQKGNNYLEFKMLHMRGTLSLSYSFLRYTK